MSSQLFSSPPQSPSSLPWLWRFRCHPHPCQRSLMDQSRSGPSQPDSQSRGERSQLGWDRNLRQRTSARLFPVVTVFAVECLCVCIIFSVNTLSVPVCKLAGDRWFAVIMKHTVTRNTRKWIANFSCRMWHCQVSIQMSTSHTLKYPSHPLKTSCSFWRSKLKIVERTCVRVCMPMCVCEFRGQSVHSLGVD